MKTDLGQSITLQDVAMLNELGDDIELVTSARARVFLGLLADRVEVAVRDIATLRQQVHALHVKNPHEAVSADFKSLYAALTAKQEPEP